MNRLQEFQAKVRELHRPAFELFYRVSGEVEGALHQQRAHEGLPGLALDMFMTQGHKSYSTVAILAQHGLMEDCATISRRLMELAVQAVYLGAEEDDQERRRKAGRYLAFLWRQLPGRLKQRLPEHVRRQWTGIGRGYGRLVPRRAKRWGPNWREMFKEVGAEDMYDTDYSFLSAIAHGSVDNQVFTFAGDTVRLHSHEFVSVLIGYASKYYLMVFEQWNREFGVVSTEDFEDLFRAVVGFKPAPVGSDGRSVRRDVR